MTLLITLVSAIISTLVWYHRSDSAELKLSTLCYLYWGASLMWFVDAFVEYSELKAEYFTPALEDMLNDTFLGLSVVTFGLLIWLVVFLISDPKGKLKKILLGNKKATGGRLNEQ